MAARDPLLISAEALRDALRAPRPPLLLDVRWMLGGPPGRGLFELAHIPSARFVDLERELAAPPGPGGRHPLPAPADFEQAMRRHGVHGGGEVVVYDAADSSAAARAWWLLRWAGHARVRVLDGGLAAWTTAGGALEPGPGPAVAMGDLVVAPGALPLLDAGAAAALARAGVLLDARAAERYRGEVEPVDPIAGHIPGARSAPTTGNLASDGRLLDPAALSARFAELGVDPSTPVGVYCGSGITAAHEVLALARAGIDAALYPGSWSDWITDSTRPVATGPHPG